MIKTSSVGVVEDKEQHQPLAATSLYNMLNKNIDREGFWYSDNFLIIITPKGKYNVAVNATNMFIALILFLRKAVDEFYNVIDVLMGQSIHKL